MFQMGHQWTQCFIEWPLLYTMELNEALFMDNFTQSMFQMGHQWTQCFIEWPLLHTMELNEALLMDNSTQIKISSGTSMNSMLYWMTFTVHNGIEWSIVHG